MGDAEVEVLVLDALARSTSDSATAADFLAAADAAYPRATHLMVDDDPIDARAVRGALAGGGVGR